MQAVGVFQGICEQSEFFALFPHRHDYIYAPHPDFGVSPDWRTESRHPLSDRLIEQGAFLYGVRFGQLTSYIVLDIDRGSLYHPERDAFAIRRIQVALEPLGLVTSIVCTSSYSGGLHLYFPFGQSCRSQQIAVVVATLLQQAGLKLKPGQLELFPNARSFVAGGVPSLFNAHRLPLQAGSYLLNLDLQPIWSDRQIFVQQWRLTQSRNSIDLLFLQQVLKQARQRYAKLTGRADKFLNDLNAEIEAGWTGYGQTNHLLGRIAMRSYIFGHMLNRSEPIAGQALVDEIVEVARSLPGYRDWCRHQHEIEHRAAEWARCIEASHYFPYGVKSRSPRLPLVQLDQPEALSWNQQRSLQTREKIQQAIAQMLDDHSLPSGATARFQKLLTFGIGGASLYRHRDLWHPKCLQVESLDRVDRASQQKSEFSTGQVGLAVENRQEIADQEKKIQNNFLNTPSLLDSIDSNALLSKSSGDRSEVFPRWAGNSEIGLRPCERGIGDRQREDRYQVQQAQRMRSYLESGDPILIKEAIAWSEAYPQWFNPRRQVGFQPTLVAKRENLASSDRIDAMAGGSVDLSDVLAAIAVHVRRLGWDRQQVRDRLLEQFGKAHRALLSEKELHQWLADLQDQSVYADSG